MYKTKSYKQLFLHSTVHRKQKIKTSKVDLIITEQSNLVNMIMKYYESTNFGSLVEKPWVNIRKKWIDGKIYVEGVKNKAVNE